MKRRYACTNCDILSLKYTTRITQLEDEVKILKIENSKLQESSNFWETEFKNRVESTEFDWSNVESEYCAPEELEIPAFKKYLNILLHNFPILNIILFYFTSSSHKRKYNASNTALQWIQWSDWYRSFICDMFLRSRSPKSVRKSNLMLSIYFLLTNLSEPSWRLLERLRIIVAKKTVENWVRRQQKKIESDSSFLIFSFDNCDFKNHVTHTQSGHRSSMIHIISQYVLEIPTYLDIPAAAVWRDVNRVNFGVWLQSSDFAVRKFSNQCFNLFNNHNLLRPLRFMHSQVDSNVI
jgi:hypothetical protein